MAAKIGHDPHGPSKLARRHNPGNSEELFFARTVHRPVHSNAPDPRASGSTRAQKRAQPDVDVDDLSVAFQLKGKRRTWSTVPEPPIFADELLFLVSPVHPWARLGRPAREAIAAETLVLYNKGSGTFHLISEYFREEKMALSNFIELGSMEAIKELVKTGFGAALIAPWTARAELRDGSLVTVPLGARKLKRRWVVAQLKGRRLAPAEQTFVELCKSAAELIERDVN